MASLMVLVMPCASLIYDEAIHTGKMPNGLATLLDVGGGSKVFFEPFPKRSFPIPLLTPPSIHLGALVPVDYPSNFWHYFYNIGAIYGKYAV